MEETNRECYIKSLKAEYKRLTEELVIVTDLLWLEGINQDAMNDEVNMI